MSHPPAGRVARARVPADIPRGWCTTERTADATIVRLHGEHDLASDGEVRETLTQALDRGSPVVVDLTRAAFVDGSVLGTVVAAQGRARRGRLGFAVAAGPATPAGRALALAGLAAELPISQDVGAALAHALQARVW